MSWVALLENIAALGVAIRDLALSVRDAMFEKKVAVGAAQAEATGDTSELEDAFEKRPK